MNPRSVLDRPPRQSPALNRRHRWVLWRSWVLATTLGEFVGLELILAASNLINRMESLDLLPTLLGVGTLEGSVLGFAQWVVLRRYLQPVAGWVLATTGGTFIAWLVGVRASILIARTFWRPFLGQFFRVLAIFVVPCLLAFFLTTFPSGSADSASTN